MGGGTMAEAARNHSGTVDILILGAGWTSTFLIPLLDQKKISSAATTTTGRDGTYKFKYEDVDHDDNPQQYAALPDAKTIIVTFPLKGKGQSTHLITSYIKNHRSEKSDPNFIQLGSSEIFSVKDQDTWVTRHSKYNKSHPRAIAEDELLARGGCVLNLSGLWGGTRQPKNWIDRVASTKEQLKGKNSLHMIHGQDVARAIIAVHQKFSAARSQRFILTDLIVYDWWTLILGFSGELDAENANSEKEKSQIKWVGELMEEQNVRALPRSMEQLGRCYDCREFWTTFGIMPVRSRI
ncbi:hypothetical protein LOCC1_G007244 [Lachnellula occidentalis]|uniref:Uncharacterized protein n=1 Tax=Lachnellula occidentalis TaxID=215460 RepID=A0A8H8U6M1_9HELO|nr:hypothetical protein LOCC1_G007244 [Lachnellula occidentalis]